MGLTPSKCLGIMTPAEHRTISKRADKYQIK